MLNKQCIADVFQDCTTAAGRTPMLRQLLGNRLNHVENLGHIFFVVRQNHAGGERIRDQ